MENALNVSGTYFESCNCFAPCSCVCLSAPTEGDCAALIAWHIDQGALGAVKLDGLNVVLFAHAPGHMMETKWRVALYLDQRATSAQQEALGQVFSGQAGGPLAALAPLIGEVMGVSTAAIEYVADGKRRSLSIAGIAEAEIEAIPGQGGGDVTIERHPFTPVPGFPAVVAKSSRFRYADHGYQREVSDRNGFYSPFQYTS
ncbi:MAG TPA: DUF1326 domain-containing protein [Accumulibacter sp.]|uniref:DUF1326 domain-containing protein n=1 Tax=Accumulibacter sp. TaxID=2053492 RepID=UPI002BC2C804|nr:DUF1326 domain-containing protein [Accumulibacter sp.]HRF71937.1 DUF1326 domain-containing protein [Accumulibacter sp.]